MRLQSLKSHVQVADLRIGSKATQEQIRGNSNSRGYTYKWRKARERYLSKHPLCVDCLAEGRVVAAKDLDHQIPHRGDQKLFWDESNWAGRCHAHHAAKTAREDGGFGNAPK